MDRAAMFGLLREFAENLFERLAALAPLPVAMDAHQAKPAPVDWDAELVQLLDQERHAAD
ncbi:hypothetical protein [Microbacterium candidum]|uniref:Uncharacterized protein n=1 Tax=Microbacterium candidum TaxID=3041922 RepID=A0ABT7N1V5_9MICO|nr:hypothetical protein [Microbacterium sp. ASV49]MDL9980656.1 hypothetical protein [Microbacterium sp. ASV49]